LQLNTRIETFPTNIIANNFGFKAAEYFKIAAEDQALPKVDLSLGTSATPRPQA
jgi:LemA protein